jgi:hypothetical protein
MLVLCLNGCYRYAYKIDIEDTANLKTIIIETEKLIKKIEILSTYKDSDYNYPLFWFNDNGITMMHTIINYNPNDSISEGRHNPNIQEHIDTCKTIPGLTMEEWNILKNNLRKLEKLGIRKNKVAYYNDAKFQFFYYSYLYPEGYEYRDIGYLALLSEDVVNTEDFKQRFIVMDKKDGIYLIKIIR